MSVVQINEHIEILRVWATFNLYVNAHVHCATISLQVYFRTKLRNLIRRASDSALMLRELRVTWATSVPILVFLGLSVLDLGPMYATDRRQTPIIA